MTDSPTPGIVVVAVALVAFAAASCSTGRSSPEVEGPSVRFGDRRVGVEIADDPDERRTGLMHRRSLATDRGMLFLFPAPAQTGFWMRNTLIPLSIAFLRRDGDRRFEVVAILDMEPCREAAAADCPRYRAGRPYDAALEVNRGWFDDAGVGVGAEAIYEPSR